MRAHLFASLATLRIGMDVLQKDEGVRLDGCSPTAGCSRPRGWPSASWPPLSTPPSRSATSLPRAAPGASRCSPRSLPAETDQSLADYLSAEVFADAELDTVDPDPADVAGFDAYIQRYMAALPVERAAVGYS